MKPITVPRIAVIIQTNVTDILKHELNIIIEIKVNIELNIIVSFN